ncbi:MAG: hypothetical protein LBL13_01635, partial [Bacteroidales bacterium]|nr:hypothetical protein [Bacteroidales bacterium]
FGFVKISGNPAHTIAHELGHGAFRLWHTFSTDKRAIYIAAQGATDNLMDYSNGTGLYKHQWDLVHDPETMLFPSSVDEDETLDKSDSEFKIDLASIKTIENVPDGIYITPAGKPVTLKGLKSIKFLDKTDGVSEISISAATVIGFTAEVNGKLETYFSGLEKDEFSGYYKISNIEAYDYYIDNEIKEYYKEGENAKKDRDYDIYLIDNGTPISRKVSKWWYYQEDWVNYKGSGKIITSLPDCDCQKIAHEYKNSPLNNSGLKSVIENDPCILNTLYKFNKGKIIFTSKWMEDFNKVFGALTNIILIPAVAETVIAPVLESVITSAIEDGTTLLTYLGKKKATDMALGAFLDVSFQSFLLGYFNDVPVEQLFEEIQWMQAVGTGIESAMNVPWFSTFIMPLYTSLGNSNSQVTKEEYINNYCIQAGAAVFVYALTSNSTSVAVRKNIGKIKEIYNAAPSKFISKLELLTNYIAYNGQPLINRERLDQIYKFLNIDHLLLTNNFIESLKNKGLNGLVQTIENISDKSIRIRFVTEFSNLSTEHADDILRKINNNPDWITAWRYIQRPEMRLDPDILYATSRLLKQHPEFTETHKETIESIYKSLAEARVGCKTCPSSVSPDLQVGYMETVIDNLNDAISKYSNLSGFNSFIREMAQTSRKAKGGAFTLKLLKERLNDLTENGQYVLKGFEGTIPDTETGNMFDLMFEQVSNNQIVKKMVEAKNWTNVQKVGDEQLLAYIKSGNKFEYYFNGTSEGMKLKFRECFKKNIDRWFQGKDDSIYSFFKTTDINQAKVNIESSSFYDFIK